VEVVGDGVLVDLRERTFLCANGAREIAEVVDGQRQGGAQRLAGRVSRGPRPGSADALMAYESRYGNFIGGEWVPPSNGEYFENPTPVTGQAFCEIPRSTEADIDKALAAAHGAPTGWGKTAPGERAAVLNKIADRIEANLESLALAEAWDNGKPIRETLAADLPLAVDHFRYFAGAIRHRRVRCRRSTRTLSPITSMSRWASSDRSSRGTSRS